MKDGLWKEEAREENPEDFQNELDFLNACYRNVKRKMRAEK